MKEIYEMKGASRSIRGIAGDLGIARNTVRRHLKSPEAMRPRPRPRRASKLDPYTEYVDRRISEGLENCVVLHRELKAWLRGRLLHSEILRIAAPARQ